MAADGSDRARWFVVARLSGALTGVAVIAVILAFKFGDVFGYVSILASIGAFAAIVVAHRQLRVPREAQGQAPAAATEIDDGDEDLDVLDVPEPGHESDAFAPP